MRYGARNEIEDIVQLLENCNTNIIISELSIKSENEKVINQK